jgi:uncharacterized protein (TIGR03790 family)
MRSTFAAAIATAFLFRAFALDAQGVLLLVNKDVPASSEVAQVYRRLRHIPRGNVLRLPLGGDREISREAYRELISGPVKKYLIEHPAIQCIVTTSGVPYLIRPVAGQRDAAAVDNELAAVLREEPKNQTERQANPLYIRADNLHGVDAPRLFQMVYVARLDGPDLATTSRMIEDTIAAEKEGLQGRVFGDAQGVDGGTGDAAADFSIRAAIDRLSGAGFGATLDLQQANWQEPAEGRGEQAAGAVFYVGRKDPENFQDIFGKQGLSRGAIAWHVAGGEAVDIWNSQSKQWCVNLMRRGAAVTVGPAFHSAESDFPAAEILVENLLLGRTVAESYWLVLPHVSSAMVLLGDPLYRPFALKARPGLVARAYVAETSTRVLRKGDTSSMLVQLQCIGPPGSATPAMVAAAQPGAGLSGAAGEIKIPGLAAGNTAVVRAPLVTASGDAAGMFRLHLDVKQSGADPRRIVLEGKTGLALISGGGHQQTQMAVSPSGEYVISGQPGNTLLTNVSTLASKRIAPTPGWILAAAAFSPDDAHIVLAVINPEHTQASLLLAQSHSGDVQNLPIGSQFLRWLDKETILLKEQTGLVKYNIKIKTRLPLFTPAGWTITEIVPETAAHVLTASDNRFSVIRKGAESPTELLKGVDLAGAIRVSKDLSVVGGLDRQKRLWIQHGVDGLPKVVAENLKEVVWGPMSRRIVTQGMNGEFRLFDAVAEKWAPLARFTAAQWSRDERRLLYLEAPAATDARRFLSLLTDARSEQLLSLDRLGEIRTFALTGNSGNGVVLLAGAAGGLQTWLLPLPPI